MTHNSPFIFLHYHIFKNAGSTIDWVLDKNFGEHFSEINDPSPEGHLSHNDIVTYINSHPNIKALSSHHFHPPFKTHSTTKFIEICILRHPIDRIRSMYTYFGKLNSTKDQNTMQAKQKSLPEYIVWLTEQASYLCTNTQTCFLAQAGDFYYPPAARDLAIATETAQQIKFLGTVDQLDKSLVCAEFFFRPIFPDLDLSYLAQNVTKDFRTQLPQKLAEIKEKCGDNIYTMIQNHNQLDVELHSRANKELDRRSKFIPKFATKLQDFRNRCVQLAKKQA